jgi:hypothetical protein
MMILKFPDLATLQLALTSGAIPPAVSRSAAVAGFSEPDLVWVETRASLSRAVQAELKRLGVQVCRSSGAALATEVDSWLELLPLEPDLDPLLGLEQTPVLFELPDGAHLSQLATEMLRLGNDRQSFRALEEGHKRDGAARVLLRVVGPPYYSLLRAIDRRGQEGAPIAYKERAAGVWVEVGFSHPLAEKIKPPRGQLLFLRPPRHWTVIADAPFRDVYEVLEFLLPDAPSRWQDGKLQTKLKVPLSLRKGGSPDNPELWVLQGDAVAELNRFVQNNDDQLLGRLAFAVGHQDGKTTIVVRVRQSRQAPPQLVLNAVGYRPHLKLPNLFLPVGMGLHPPLRRDKVRELFAEDVNRVHWLSPGEDGTFTPQSLPEDAFLPLTQWVDYVLDRDRQELQAWMQAAQFDFESFVCNEDGTPRKKPEPPEPKHKGKDEKGPKKAREAEDNTAAFEAPRQPEPEEEPELDDFGAVAAVEPSELQKELRALEQQFVELEGGLDAPERRALWPKLARCNSLLQSGDDAGICWLHALWGEKAVPAGWAWNWFCTEAVASQPPIETGLYKAPRTWLTRFLAEGCRSRELTADELDLLLKTKEPTTGDLRALAAYLVWAGSRKAMPAALAERLQPIQFFLEAHERLLPIRGTWLAWLHLSAGDVLTVARARDRLLERLFQNGLRPEQDLPGFLRFADTPTSQRFRAVREWMTGLADLTQKWVQDNASTMQKPPMDAYVDLVFSFGLARLGEAEAARDLLSRAQEGLAGKDDAHAFLLEAFRYRIRQALDGKPHTGPLPAELLNLLRGMVPLLNYVVDRLRRHSRILEPDQEIDPYRKWGARMSELDNQLADMADLTDRKEIAARVQRVLKGLSKGMEGVEQRAKVLKAALEAAPRVGEEFAREMLDLGQKAYDALPEPADVNALTERATFLEKALFVAAHFDSTEHLHPLVARFEAMLQSQSGSLAIQALEKLAGRCFRGLRKLGMRDQIDPLLRQMADLVLEGKDLESLDPAGLRAMLLVAEEWYFFGRDAQAEPVLQAVRKVLLSGELVTNDHRAKEQTALAAAYARTVGQAPVAVAQKRLEEIVTSVKGVRDTYTTSSHFSVSQFDVIEAVVLAVVSDDFTLGPQARRWLDEDEFLVRRRIHTDVKALKGNA